MTKEDPSGERPGKNWIVRVMSVLALPVLRLFVAHIGASYVGICAVVLGDMSHEQDKIWRLLLYAPINAVLMMLFVPFVIIISVLWEKERLPPLWPIVWCWLAYCVTFYIILRVLRRFRTPTPPRGPDTKSSEGIQKDPV